MKKILIVALALLASCVPPKPPVTPHPSPTRGLGVSVVDAATGLPIAGADVSVNDGTGPKHQTTPVSGFVVFTVANVTYADVVVTAQGYHDRTDNVRAGLPANLIESLVALPPPMPSAGESGALHVARDPRGTPYFARPDGSIYPWAGTDAFALFVRFRRGEDIQPIVTDYLTCGGLCRAGQGPTLFRVLGMGAPPNAFAQTPDGDPYYADLRRFVDLLAVRGVRAEIVVFADAQIVMPSRAAEEAHIRRVADALAGTWSVVLEVCNEPLGGGKNIPGDGQAAHELGQLIQGRGLLVASGDYDVPDFTVPFHHLDFVTFHPDRGKVRSAKDVAELRDNDPWAVHVPVVDDEWSGAAEAERPGSRLGPNADDPTGVIAMRDMGAHAATAMLEGAGATFHSDSGIAAVPLGPFQAKASASFFRALHWVPPAAQLWPYQRGGDCGTGGIGNMPIEHCDAPDEPQPGHSPSGGNTSVRSFCKSDGATEYCAVLQPSAGWVMRARDGWLQAGALVEGLARGLVKLTRLPVERVQ